MLEAVAGIGPGRMGRQIALTGALGGCRARLVDLKPRPDARAALADARREIARDLRLMAEEDVIKSAEVAPALERIEDRTDLAEVESCGFVQEALPESVELKREVFTRLTGRVADDAIVASTSSTISPRHLADAVPGPERFLVVHWLNPAHVIPLVEVVPGAATSAAVVDRTITFLTHLGKTPVRCGDAPGFIVSRLQVVLMNEAVRLVEEGLATPEEGDRAIRGGLGVREAGVRVVVFIDMGGVRILYPGRAFIAHECGSDACTWTELSGEGVVHGFTVQETGLPVGFDGPRVFAIVKVDGHRVFTILVAADPARLRIGQRVRLTPLRVTDDAKGQPRWLPAFTPDS